MRSLMVTVVLAVLAMAAPAHATPFPGYPGESPARPEVVSLSWQAEAFWAAPARLGSLVQERCPDGLVVMRVATLLVGAQDAWGAGWHDGSDCQMWLTDDLIDAATGGQSFWRTVDGCTAVTHEVGHALGLAHTPTGVMSASVPPFAYAWTPYFCLVYALHLQELKDRAEGGSRAFVAVRRQGNMAGVRQLVRRQARLTAAGGMG